MLKRPSPWDDPATAEQRPNRGGEVVPSALRMRSMLASLTLPESVQLVRATPTFDAETVPPGLLRGHTVAPGTWALLRVHAGSVTFVLEGSGESRRLGAGEAQVIEPDVVHHVVVGPGASFAVEFYR